MVPLLALLGWWGGLARWAPDLGADLLLLAVASIVFPAIAEEAVFRGALLKAPRAGGSGVGPAMLSAVLFALYHPLQALLYEPLWADIAWSPTFLLACAALGFAAARAVLSTGSIWPAVLLHWVVVVVWKGFFDGPF